MASGCCQARDETLADRIGNLREDSRDGLVSRHRATDAAVLEVKRTSGAKPTSSFAKTRMRSTSPAA